MSFLGGLDGGKKLLLELILAIAGTILFFGLIQYVLANYMGIQVSIVSDVWNALAKIPRAIGDALYEVIYAIGQFLASPFLAFKNTLMAVGLPAGVAQALAIVIIGVVFLVVLYGIGRWRGWF